jgi:hypothetical protein
MTRRFLAATAAVSAVVALLSISACSGGDNNTSSSNALPGAQPARGLAAQSLPASNGASGAAGQGYRPGGGEADLSSIRVTALDRAQIKTASIELRSDKIADVVTSLEQVASSEGGFIDSENTATDVHGVASASTVTLRVPVDRFETAVDEVSALGQLASKRTTTQDVTGRVADVNSRVQSARDAISQLRLLFNRATKLGDIITLESQLSSREADLEALEAQQRALDAQTSMSTISVHVTRPPVPVAKPHHESTSGFVGGLRQGWDALGSTATAFAHGLGAVLPLGIVLIGIGLLAWALVRRIPRHRPDTSG